MANTLNPDLLSKDFDAVLNNAVTLKDDYRKPTLIPEIVLLALLKQKDTCGGPDFQCVYQQPRGRDGTVGAPGPPGL